MVFTLEISSLSLFDEPVYTVLWAVVNGNYFENVRETKKSFLRLSVRDNL